MIRHALRGLLNTGILLALLLVAVIAFAQTAPGKRMISAQLSSFLSTAESTIEIEGLQGWIPIDMRLDRLRIADQDGLWLEATGIVADWSPTSLLNGRIQIDRLRAEQVHLSRIPESTEEIEEANEEPFKLPELPTSLPPITVTELAIPEIVLDAPVMGEAASFDLDGSLTASDDGRDVDLTIDVQRLDQPTAFLSLTSTMGLDPLTLALDLDANETGNLLAQLTGQASAGDLDLALSGKGPLDDWSGELSLQADGLGVVEAGLFLALLDQPHLRISAKARPAKELVPEDVEDLLEDGLNLDLALTQTKAQAIAIERIDLSTNQVGLKAAGKVDFDQGDLLFEAALDLPDLEPLSRIANLPLEGQAGLGLNVDGTLQQPEGQISLNADRLSLDGTKVNTLKSLIDWRATTPLDRDAIAFDVTASGSLEGIDVPDTELPDENLTWQAALDLPLEGSISVRDAVISTAGATLNAKGAVDPSTLISDLDVQLKAPALSNLVAAFGSDLDGDTVINAAIETSAAAETINVDLNAVVDQLKNLPDGAKELLGSKLDLKAVGNLDSSRYLQLRDVQLNGTEVMLQGSLDLDLESQALSSDIVGTLPRLAVLADLVQQPITGAIDLEATIGGDLDAPIAEVTVTGDHLDIADETINGLVLTWNGSDLATTPKGALELSLNARSLPLAIALNYQLEDQVLALPDVQITAPETTLGGNLVIDLDTVLFDGVIGGDIGDLAALRPIHEQDLKGSLKLDAKLTRDQARQNTDLAVALQNLEGDFGRIDDIKATAAVRDLLGEAIIAAKADLQGFKQDEITLSALTLKTDGNQDQLNIDLDLAGDVLEPLTLAADGSISLKDPLAIDLDRLDGLYAGEELNLAQPLHIEQDDKRIELAGLDLRLGQANLRGDVDIGPTLVEGRIDLQDLPLTWLERFGGPAIEGLAEASITLAGKIDDPLIESAIDLKDIETDQITDTDLPPLNVAVRTKLDNGRMTSSLVATGITQEPVTASATHPLTLALNPFAFAIPSEGDLKGTIKADLQLARIGDLLALDQQIMMGQLSADLTLAGTIGAPLLDGPIVLEDGIYENSFSGTSLRDLTLKAAATSERITINQLSGVVGKDGSLKAEGWMDLDPDTNFPLSVTLNLQDAELVSRDDIEATITGDITMLGNLSDASIEGDLTVQPAEVYIPDGGGPSLPDIDIEEIGGNIVNSVKEKKEQKTPAFDPELDLKFDVPNRVYVKGRGLESEWQGDIKIAGRTSDPRITGDLSVKTGYFDFIEKRFEIEEGRVDFNGASPPDPILRIEAATTDDDFKAIVKLDGPAQDPEFRLESEPVLPEDEVLARLLFDRELSEIGVVEAGKLALALNKLRSGGGGGFDAFGEIRNALNIDTLDVVSDETGQSKVKAGKYLSDDVYFELERGSADESGRARVEIEILPNISLEADTGEDANGGVGVKWRYDY